MIQPMFFPESRDGKVSGDHHASPCAGVGPNDHTVDYRPGLSRNQLTHRRQSLRLLQQHRLS